MNGYRYLTLQQRREIEIMYTSPENPISNFATSKAKKGPEKRTKHSKTASFETVLCWCSSGDSNPGFLPRFARKSFYFNIYRLAAKAATVDLAFVSGVLDRQNSSKRDGLLTVSFFGAPAGIRTPAFCRALRGKAFILIAIASPLKRQPAISHSCPGFSTGKTAAKETAC